MSIFFVFCLLCACLGEWNINSIFLEILSVFFLCVDGSNKVDGKRCNNMYNKCKSNCLISDLNPQSCYKCCDLVQNMCLDDGNRNEKIENKFLHCFDRNDIIWHVYNAYFRHEKIQSLKTFFYMCTVFSNRLHGNQHKRLDDSARPQAYQNHTKILGYFQHSQPHILTALTNLFIENDF